MKLLVVKAPQRNTDVELPFEVKEVRRKRPAYVETTSVHPSISLSVSL